MATTRRKKDKFDARAGADRVRGTGRTVARRAVGHSANTVVVVIAQLLTLTPAIAAKWSVDSGVSSEVTWTSNAALGEGGTVGSPEGQKDTIFDIRPHVRFRGEGDRLKISGSAALSGIAYANHTQPSALLPQADVDANLEAIERFLFIDAGFRAVQTSANPFGAQTQTNTRTQNTVTTTQGRVSPSIQRDAGDLMRYRLRSDNTWTHDSGGGSAPTVAGAAGYFGLHTLLFEHDPKPFGWRLEAQRSETRYKDPTIQPIVLDLARLGVSYAVTPDLAIGVHGGAERENFVAQNDSHSIYGFDAKWQPSPRTTLAAFEEKRFFGKSWKFAFDHRTPFVALNVVASRTIETAPQTLFDLPATENVAALLDAAFTTRYPDPIERAHVVQDFIARQGLPTSTLQPISVQAARLSLVNTRSATVTLLGERNTVSLGGYLSRTEDVPDANIFATGSPLTNNNQYGVSLALSRRLAPTTVLVVSADWRRIRALDSVGGDQSTQKTARVRLNIEATPKTAVYGGVRYTDLDSNSSVTSGREGAVFVGVDHRF